MYVFEAENMVLFTRVAEAFWAYFVSPISENEYEYLLNVISRKLYLLIHHRLDST